MPTPLSNVSQNKARTFVFYAIAILAHVAPSLAGRIALRLFSTPTRTAPKDADRGLADAEPWTIAYAGRRLAVWRWKPVLANGLKVLLVHGWSGNATQFARWIPALTARGYDVYAFDGPAHGKSTGRRTNLVDFAGSVRQVGAVIGDLHAVVAHSMGGSATMIALSEGLRAERIVLISAPENVEARIERFAGWLKLPTAVRAAMERLLARRFGKPLSAVRLGRLAPKIGLPVLVVHDAEDREIPWFEGVRTATALPEGRLHTVRGLGHTRVLRDEGVIEMAVDFVTAGDEDHFGLRDAHFAAYIDRVEAA